MLLVLVSSVGVALLWAVSARAHSPDGGAVSDAATTRRVNMLMTGTFSGPPTSVFGPCGLGTTCDGGTRADAGTTPKN